MQKKISLIGAGNIGGTIAHLAYLKQLGNVVLFDINEGVAKGKALDISQSSFVHKKTSSIIGTNNYEDIKDSDVIIVTAGVPRKPGMSRDDLIEINTKVISEVAKNIAKYSPNAFVICVTNPLDVMVWVLQEVSKLPKEKVVGMAGILDSSRFAYFLSQALNVGIEEIQCFVLGGHGDTMVPVVNYVTIAGIPLSDYIKNNKISQDTVNKIVERTRNGGGEIVNLMGTSAFYAPAASSLSMAESYLLNQNRVLPCAVWVNGQYGVNGLYLGVPAKINNKGIVEVIEVKLEQDSQENLAKSIKAVEDLVLVAKKFL